MVCPLALQGRVHSLPSEAFCHQARTNRQNSEVCFPSRARCPVHSLPRQPATFQSQTRFSKLQATAAKDTDTGYRQILYRSLVTMTRNCQDLSKKIGTTIEGLECECRFVKYLGFLTSFLTQFCVTPLLVGTSPVQGST